MIRRVQDTLHAAVESVTPGQAIVAGAAGGMAQIMAVYEASLAAILQIPFWVLTFACTANMLTGGFTALLQKRFSGVRLIKTPARWFGYVISAILIAQGGLLFQSLTSIEVSPAPAIIAGLYTLAFLKEGQSTIENIGGPDVIQGAWSQIASLLSDRGDK